MTIHVTSGSAIFTEIYEHNMCFQVIVLLAILLCFPPYASQNSLQYELIKSTSIKRKTEGVTNSLRIDISSFLDESHLNYPCSGMCI